MLCSRSLSLFWCVNNALHSCVLVIREPWAAHSSVLSSLRVTPCVYVCIVSQKIYKTSIRLSEVHLHLHCDKLYWWPLFFPTPVPSLVAAILSHLCNFPKGVKVKFMLFSFRHVWCPFCQWHVFILEKYTTFWLGYSSMLTLGVLCEVNVVYQNQFQGIIFADLISLVPKNYMRTLWLNTSLFGRLTLTSVSAEQITGRRFFPPLSDGAACLRHSRVLGEVVVEEE